jgi:hypothetical protein
VLQSGRFTSPRSTLHKSYVFCTTLQFCYLFILFVILLFVLYNLFIVPILTVPRTMHKIHPICSMLHFYFCLLQHCKKCIESLQHCIFWHNVLRWGRMGTMKRLYEIHYKIATLYKTHRICVKLTLERWIVQTVLQGGELKIGFMIIPPLLVTILKLNIGS